MKLRICTFNLENLFIFLDFYKGQPVEQFSESEWQNLTFSNHPNKPLFKLLEIAQIIKEESWDVIMGCEIGGIESLENFNKLFLDSQYDVKISETNSRRGIDVGFLVKKGLPFNLALKSNRNFKLNTQGDKFSRDVAELWLTSENYPPIVCLVTHLKSKISTAEDYGGMNTRKLEAEGVVKIYQALRQKHPEALVLLGGDFNANVSKELCEREMQIFHETDLVDVHDLKASPKLDRTTHYRVGEESPHSQIDYLMMSPNVQKIAILEESHTYRYKERFYDMILDFPSSLKEKQQLPSDHYPVVLTLKLPENN